MSATSDDMRQAWQRQALDAPRISLAYLHHQTQRLRRRVHARNAFEYLGGIVAMIWLISAGWDFIWPRPIMSFGVALWVLGMLIVSVQWHRRAAMSSPAEQFGTLDALQFYRQELVRQRDARRGSWLWWLSPIAPSLVVLLAAMIVEVKPTPWIAIGAMVGWVILGVTMGVAGYERAARGIQTEIDALDSMTKTDV